MMNELKICVVSVAAVMLLASCQSKEPPAQPAAATAKTTQVKPAEPVKAQEKPFDAAQALPAPPKLRNPFSNYLLNLKAQGAKQSTDRIKGPLECCEPGAFRLIAVVSAPDNTFALVLAPDGKRYFVHAGDMMGMKEGKVVRLDPRSITVRENVYDELGKLVTHDDIVIRLPGENELRPKVGQ